MKFIHFKSKLRTRYNVFCERFHKFDEASLLRVAKQAELEPTPEEKALFDKWSEEIAAFVQRPGTADQSLSLLIVMTLLRNRPDIVVETGVWHGVSSFYALKALEHNNKGFLLSLDLPPLRPQFRVQIGSAVPNSLRHRWTLLLGPSVTLLQSIRTEIDIFIHDSEHTYLNMISEYSISWDKLKKGGFLLSDDIHTNAAFTDFCPGNVINKTAFQRIKGGFIGLQQKSL